MILRHPLGIPSGADAKVFLPYLSNKLLHRFDLFRACNADQYRQHPNPNLKGPFGLWGSGISSGSDEQAELRTFNIERTKAEKDGSYRMYVKLTAGAPPVRPWIWRVAVLLVRENGHFVVNDVISLRDPEHRGPADLDRRLSENSIQRMQRSSLGRAQT